MKLRSLMTAICVLATANIVSAAPYAYVANSGTKTVSVIDTQSNTVTATVTMPDTNGAGTLPNPYPYSVAVGASGQNVYVGLQDTNEVTVIDAFSNTVVKRIGLGTDSPGGLAVNTAETRLYVASNKSNTLIVIDISGATASEVGRVAVDDSALSNPEGVVLNPAGTKAYVANSSKGSIAEISLNETANLYTRTNLIALGANTQPMGLAINSTGTKLYVASAVGVASVIDTTSLAVTDASVAAGYSVSVSNDNNKVYFPSSSLDKVYVTDAAGIVSASPTTPGAPWGSAMAPNGNLYLSMFSGDSVKVFDTTSNTVTNTTNLPAGAKPISMGDFVGPTFTNTITATSIANCTISPSGAVPVNSYGRIFTMTATGGVCQWVVGGSNTSNTGSSYTVIPPASTVTAAFTAGTPFTLTGDWSAAYGGWIVSNPAGINQTTKTAQFVSPTSVTLSVNDPASFQILAGSWTGACAGSTTSCSLTMDANKTFGVTIIPKQAGGNIYNVTKGTYHDTCVSAFSAATTGDQIKVSTAITGCTTTGTSGVTAKVSNQWDSGFSAQGASYVPMTLTITGAGVTIDSSYSIKL